MSEFCLFTLASGRSGTTFLADFFKKNTLQCFSTHEPYFIANNPNLFSRAIEWNTREDDEHLLPLLKQKCSYIQQCKEPVYFEANHAFLKSFNRHAHTLLENVAYLHVVRHPLQVAKSELLREQVLRRFRMPFIDYAGYDGAPLFRWSLTGQEMIYAYFARQFPDFTLSRFGFYVLQWFEIELRAMRLVNSKPCGVDVFFIDVNQDLYDAKKLKTMLEFFDIPHKPQLDVNLKRNKTWFAGSSDISPEEYAEFRFILDHLPEHYLEIFHHPPYVTSSFYKDLFSL